MNNIPFLYFIFTVLFAGIAVCALLQFSYTYSILRRKETFLSLLFSFTVLTYISADALALVFSYFLPHAGSAAFFLIFRETFMLVFPVVLLAYIGKFPGQGRTINKLNSILFWCAVAGLLIISSAAIFRPGMMISGLTGNSVPIYKVYIQGSDMGPLFVIKNIILVACTVYSLFIILNFGLVRQDIYSARYIIAGMLIIAYFISFYVYSSIFSPDGHGGSSIIPSFSLGIVSSLLFITWGRVKIVVEKADQMEMEKTVLEFSIYNDIALKIPGRIAFQKDLQDEVARVESDAAELFIVFFDIDDFRSLNECYGESVGDEILKMLVERLIELFSPGGSIYRIGGDEFALLLWDSGSIEDACDIAGKIITCLRNPFRVSGITCMITASAGVLQVPKDGRDVSTILSNAYRVIGSAKKTKNTYQVFTQDLADVTSRKIHAVNILRNSIVRNDFALFYQPIVDSNKRLVHAEALLRYTGTDRSIGAPDKYLPILEDAGLMKEVDNMVVHKAFQDMEMKIRNRFSTSINLSTSQLVDPAYSGFLSSFAAQHGIDKGLITLEVTEDRLMENISSGRESLSRLKESGFRIAIDDFGKGFSSLTYLAELPVDILKMDMVFTQSVPGNSRKEAMVRHILELAHSLDLQVIAEGFETQEQFEFFRGLGCDLFQGYYFSRPVPVDELIAKYV